jgi:hypothetical protein
LTALDVQRFLKHRQSLLAKLARVNAALTRADEYEANQHLPPDPRWKLHPPTISRRDLADLHRMLVEELGRLEQGTGDGEREPE